MTLNRVKFSEWWQDEGRRKKITVTSELSGTNLGFIFYYGDWRCHVWEQLDEIIMSQDCLRQVANKLAQLDAERKAKAGG